MHFNTARPSWPWRSPVSRQPSNCYEKTFSIFLWLSARANRLALDWQPLELGIYMGGAVGADITHGG
jgi:hypothetical protein